LCGPTSRLAVWAVARAFFLLLHHVVAFEGGRSRVFTHVGLALLALNTCVFLFHGAVLRVEHVSFAFEPPEVDPSVQARMLSEFIAAEVTGLLFWATSSVVAVPVYVWARVAHRQTRPLRWWEGLPAVLIFAIAGCALRRVNALIYRAPHSLGPIDPRYNDRFLDEALRGALVPMNVVIVIVVVLCAVVGGGAAWRALSRTGASPIALPAAGAVFALGLGSFSPTRAHYSDARARISPRLSPPCRCDEWVVDGMPVSSEGAAAEFVESPVATIKSESFGSVDGVPVTPSEFSVILRNKRELWEAIRPHTAFPGVLVLSIPARLAMKEIEPWLERARRAKFGAIHALVRAPPGFVETKTLGRIERSAACTTVRLGEERLPMGNWGELVLREGE